ALPQIEPHPSAHGRHQAVGYEEPEAGSGHRWISRHSLTTVELREDPPLLLFGDADSLVVDSNLSNLAVGPGSHNDLAAVRGKLDRIVNEVCQNLPQFVSVRLRIEPVGGQVDDEIVTVGTRGLLGQLDDIGNHGTNVGRCEVDMQVAGIEPGDVEELVDDRGQALRLRSDIAEERPALLLPEEHVLAKQRLSKAIDRGQRRPQL